MASSASEPAPASAEESPAPTRIKRNTACVRCRDAKVRCNASLNPNQRCMRCSKLDLDCVIDKGHKRTSRRSKLEELAAELRNIKEVVGASSPGTAPVPSFPPPLRPDQLPNSHTRQPYVNPTIVPSYTSTAAITPTFAGAATVEPPPLTPNLSTLAAVSARISGQTAEPRALASRVFSGDDIDYYFEKYFQHYHPFLPIVRSRDPDLCYRCAPLLFWAIIVTACRRYPRDETTFKFLIASIPAEIWNALASVPIRPAVINALLILSTWPLPDMRFMTDPTYVYTGTALNACLYLGLHTGKGSFLEFGTPKYRLGSTDEEAIYTWSACNIVSQRVASYMGYPPVAPFTGKSLDKVLCGHNPFNMPRSYTIALQATKFANKLSKTMTATLEESSGISHHLVDQAEEEFLRLQHSLQSGVPDADDFTLRCVLLEVHILYWLPLPGSSDETLSRCLTKSFHTSEGLIRLALQLERNFSFLSHAPHFVFRSLLTAACVIMAFLRSPYAADGEEDKRMADLLVRDTVAALSACSVLEGDLCMRGPYLMESFWNMRKNMPRWDTRLLGTSNFTHRLGASIVYDCLGRWKRDVERIRENAGGAPPRPGEDQANVDTLPTATTVVNSELGLTDPLFQRMDWGSFMDDFEWNPSADWSRAAP